MALIALIRRPRSGGDAVPIMPGGYSAAIARAPGNARSRLLLELTMSV